MKMDAIAPVIVSGTRIYLASGAGGFDVCNCPNAQQLAIKIAVAVNAHESLVAALERASILGALERDAALGDAKESEEAGEEITAIHAEIKAALALARKGGE